jgi:site-specific DNA recombinase
MELATARRAGIYTRISSDPKDQKLGVQRQEADCRKLCAQRGWQVAEIFCDNDTSAFNRRKPRPRYTDMLHAVRTGKIDTIVCWHPDRLHRQNRELVGFIDLVNDHHVHIQTVTAGEYDLASASGRNTARILGSVAEYESEHKSERIRRKLEQNAIDGKPHGGSRPYGWHAHDLGRGRYCTVNPEEAAVVIKATHMLLSGQSLRSITKALNAEGATTATGKPWKPVGVRDMINRPRNAGLRSRGRARHDGSRRSLEILGPGADCEPIITAEEFYQAHAILSNPARRTSPEHLGRKHLLSGIARCGLCGDHMIATGGTMSTRKGDHSYPHAGKAVYRCRECGKITRSQVYVDDLVTKVILARLALPDAKELLVDHSQIDKARAALITSQQLQERLDDAAGAYGAGVITIQQLTTITAAIKPQIEKAQAEVASPDRTRVLGDLVSLDPSEVWSVISPDQRRAAVALLLNVTILPTRRGPGFDPNAVQITWST